MSLFIQTIADGFLTGGIYALIALGLTLIFGVMRVLNMAHGEFVMIGMFITYFAHQYLGIDPYLTIPLSGIFVFFLGIFLYKFGVGKIDKTDEINTLLFTAGASLFFANLIQMLFSANYRRISLDYGTSSLDIGFASLATTKFISFFITGILVFLLWYFLSKTTIGLSIRAASQDEMAATIVGINVKKISMITFGIGAGFSAIAGTMLTAELSFYPAIGTVFIIKAFIIVVLGGLGSIPGAALGGLVLGIAEALGSVYISSGYRDAYGLILFILILLFMPQGLSGLRQLLKGRKTS